MRPTIEPTGGGPLTTSGRATFDPAGRAEVVLGPVPPRGVWLISRLTVSATGPSDPMPAAYVYEGDENPANLLDATWTGTQDVSDFGTPHQLDEAEYLTVVWTGGTAGETATARLIGRQGLR